MAIIYAFEGPSGAGKSYAVKKTIEMYPNAPILERPAMPREQKPWFGAYSSSYLEYQAIAYATMSQGPVIVDRFMMSRWIYRAIQDNNGRLQSAWYNELTTSWRNLKNVAMMEAWNRLANKSLLQPTAIITVLLPPLHQLQFQRQTTNKQYPFPAQLELELYTEMAQRLRSDPIPGISVEIDRY